MRGAGKIKFWTGGYINRPGVTPPLFLRLIMIGLLLLSMATVFFGVFGVMGHFDVHEDLPVRMIITAVLFFLLPILVVYALVTNHPSSRPVLILFLAAVSAFIAHDHFAGPAAIPDMAIIAVFVAFATIAVWLYASPRCRVYFALIRGEDIPDDLQHLAGHLIAPTATERFARRTWDILEPLSPVVLIALAILFVYAGFSNLWP